MTEQPKAASGANGASLRALIDEAKRRNPKAVEEITLAAKAEEMAGHLRHVADCGRSMCEECGLARRFLRAEGMP